MSEINIMDFDPSSSIKSYNFTNTAIRRFYDTIDSEQFKDEKKEKPHDKRRSECRKYKNDPLRGRSDRVGKVGACRAARTVF